MSDYDEMPDGWGFSGPGWALVLIATGFVATAVCVLLGLLLLVAALT